ncbi:MAG: DUF2155 domain-containing protein [Hyphomonadaceae bacterium]|nr:DUF2155 domain-containing protein [Hyphomonadaceae bacterium]
MIARLLFAFLALAGVSYYALAQQPELVQQPAGEGEDLLEEEEEPQLEVRRWRQYQVATLRGLDKITGRSTDLEMRVGEAQIFGSLKVDLQVCFQTPPDFPPESAAFLQVRSLKPISDVEDISDEPLIFSGWMFASSPGLNALEHPVYDVWVIHCSREVLSPESEE